VSEVSVQSEIALNRGEEMSFVAACQHFFSTGRYGKKIAIQEFKALTQEDKQELRELLIGEGYNVRELAVPAQ
jgi:hypothetical protein